MNARYDALGVRVAIAVAVLVLGAAALATAPNRAAAQGRAPQMPPVAGAWCGLADNGVVQMMVSADSRFVEWINVATDRGSLSSAEGGVVVPRAQIADDKFIFLGRGGENQRCEPVRCTGPACLPGASGRNRPGGGRETCNTEAAGIMLRGTFLSPEYVRGTYTGVLASESVPGGNRNAGNRSTSRRIVGTYVAWPAGVAPCP